MFLSPQQIRWCGWLLFGSALLLIIVSLFGVFIPAPPLIITAILALLGGLIVGISFPGTYLKQRDEIGILGRIGFFLLWLASLVTALVAGITEIILAITTAHPDEKAISPIILNSLSLLSLLILIGALLYGAQTIRARLFPASAGWLLIAAVIANTLELFMTGIGGALVAILSAVLLQSGFARLGYALGRWPDEIEIEPDTPEEVSPISNVQQ